MRTAIYVEAAVNEPDHGQSGIMQLWLKPDTDEERGVLGRLLSLNDRDDIMVWWGDIEIDGEETTGLKLDLLALPEREPAIAS